MAQLRQGEEEIAAAGGRVVLIGMGKPEEAEYFRERLRISFPLVCDPERKLYAAFGLQRMSGWDMLSPSMVLKGLSAMSQGHLMGIPSGDVKQLAGVFVIDREGRIRYTHISRDPADNPSVDEIVQALEGIEGGGF